MTGEEITLVSQSGSEHKLSREAAVLSELVKVTIDGWASESDEQGIPLPTMKSEVLSKVVDFCNHCQEEPMSKLPQPIKFGRTVQDHVQEWYCSFLEGLGGTSMLIELMLAANYMDIKPLFDLTSATLGLLIMNKTPDQVRETLGIEGELSPDIERRLREENKWSTEPASPPN